MHVPVFMERNLIPGSVTYLIITVLSIGGRYSDAFLRCSVAARTSHNISDICMHRTHIY